MAFAGTSFTTWAIKCVLRKRWDFIHFILHILLFIAFQNVPDSKQDDSHQSQRFAIFSRDFDTWRWIGSNWSSQWYISSESRYPSLWSFHFFFGLISFINFTDFLNGYQAHGRRFPSGAMVLVKNNQIKNSLKKARRKPKSTPLKDMIGVMLDQLHLYIDEALECDALVLETVMHPCYWLAFFPKAYTEHKECVKTLSNKAFSSPLEDAKHNTEEQPAANDDAQPVEDNDDDGFNDFTAISNVNPVQTAQEAEMDSYLMGQRKFDKLKTALDWWNVSTTSTYSLWWDLNWQSHDSTGHFFSISSVWENGTRLPRSFRHLLRGREGLFKCSLCRLAGLWWCHPTQN